MKAIIRDMGIEDWEPQVIQQLLEYSYKYEYIALNTSNTDTCMNTLNTSNKCVISRYVTDLVIEAKMLSHHARKRTIEAEAERNILQSMRILLIQLLLLGASLFH